MLTLLLTAGCLWYLVVATNLAEYVDLGVYSAIAFSILSIVIYIMTKMISSSEKKTIFIQLIMLNMLSKMTFSAIIVYIYYVVKSPSNGMFIIPFLIVYILFTVFETYFMNEQAMSGS